MFGEFFAGFDWDLSFLAFLYYCFAVFTYYLPGADVAMVVALAALVTRIHTLRWHGFLLALLVFVAWTGISVLTSDYRAESWTECWNMMKVALVAFTAFNVITNRTRLRIALAVLGGCFVLFPMRGAFVNYLGGYSTFGRALWNYAYANPNDLAVYAIAFLAFLLALLPLVHVRMTRLMIMGASALSVLLILFTQSRGALVALFVAGALSLLSQRRQVRTLVIAAAVLGIAAAFAPAGVWNRLSGLRNLSMEGGMRGVDQEGSAEQRFQIAKIAATVAADHPLTGVGIGTYPYSHRLYAAELSGELGLAGGKRDAHNTYLLIAAELGVPGLILFIAMLLSAVYLPKRTAAGLSPTDRGIVRTLRLGLLACMLAGVFGSIGYMNILYVLLAILAAAPGVLAVSATARVSRVPRS